MRAKPCALRTCVFLAACGLVFAQHTTTSPLPPVYFNHATIFVSPSTYDQVRQSAFVRDKFSGMQEQTVQRDGGKWSYTGIYIFGEHSYLELFKAGQDQPRYGTTIPGQIVFNMSIDDRSQLPHFKDRLASETGASLLMETARNADNQPVYDTVVSKNGLAGDFGPGMRVDTHLKGYYNPDGFTKEKRVTPEFVPERQMHEITGFTLAVDEAERKRLDEQFRAYSYDMTAEGATQLVSGPEISFTLVPAKPSGPRTLIVEFSTNRAVWGQKPYNFGHGGELRLEGNTGQWVFNFPSD